MKGKERERERERDRETEVHKEKKQAPTQMILRTEKEIEKVPRWSRSRPKIAGRFGALSTPNRPEARMGELLRGRSAPVKPGARWMCRARII